MTERVIFVCAFDLPTLIPNTAFARIILGLVPYADSQQACAIHTDGNARPLDFACAIGAILSINAFTCVCVAIT